MNAFKTHMTRLKRKLTAPCFGFQPRAKLLRLPMPAATWGSLRRRAGRPLFRERRYAGAAGTAAQRVSCGETNSATGRTYVCRGRLDAGGHRLTSSRLSSSSSTAAVVSCHRAATALPHRLYRRGDTIAGRFHRCTRADKRGEGREEDNSTTNRQSQWAKKNASPPHHCSN